MDFKKLFRKDEKAVSPVIGVILMVAITVILAAAIGSSVFNQNPAQTASKASINVKAEIDGTTNYIIIEHLGGDKLKFGEGGNAKLTASFNGGTSIEIDTSITGNFSAGDVKQIEVKKASTETIEIPGIKADDTANIKITDIATNQVVCDRDVRFTKK